MEEIEFYLNGKLVKANKFKKGDKVQRIKNGIDRTDMGIVKFVENNGMIVTVDWIGEAKQKCGSQWLANSLILIS